MSTSSSFNSSNMSAYSPIDVSGLGQQRIEFNNLSLYRNNLVQISKRYNYLFVALESRIYVYTPSFPSQTCLNPPAFILRSDPIVPVVGYFDPRYPHAINSLRIGDLGFEEVLVSAHDDGDVCIWYTRDLSRIAMRLSVGHSAWGLALHKERRLLAVSANSHNITIFQLGIGQQEERTKTKTTGLDQDEDEFEDCRQYEKKRRRRTDTDATDPPRRTYASVAASGLSRSPSNRLPALTLEDETSPYPYRTRLKTLKGHENNIPSISFLDEPTGRWLVGTDIDGVVIIWDIEVEKIVEKTQLGRSEGRAQVNPRGWSVIFLKPECFKPVRNLYEALGYPTPPDKAKTPNGSKEETFRSNNGVYDISPIFLSDFEYMPSDALEILQELGYEHAIWENINYGDSDDDADGDHDDEQSEGAASTSGLSDLLLNVLTNEDINDLLRGDSIDLPMEGDDEDATMAGLGDIASRVSELETRSTPPVDEGGASQDALFRNDTSPQRRPSEALTITQTLQSSRKTREIMKPKEHSAPLDNTVEAQQPPLSFVFSTTEHNCQLLHTRSLTHLVLCRHLLHLPPPSQWFHQLGGFDRLNMVCIIPELSTVVAASQKGRAAIFRLTRYGNQFLMRLDYILPREQSGVLGTRKPDDHQYRPPAALLGIATGPIQGREVGIGSRRGSECGASYNGTVNGSGECYGAGRRKSGWRGVENQRRYRLMMVYIDGTVLSYELGRDPNGGSILADGFLMV